MKRRNFLGVMLAGLVAPWEGIRRALRLRPRQLIQGINRSADMAAGTSYSVYSRWYRSTGRSAQGDPTGSRCLPDGIYGEPPPFVPMYWKHLPDGSTELRQFTGEVEQLPDVLSRDAWCEPAGTVHVGRRQSWIGIEEVGDG